MLVVCCEMLKYCRNILLSSVLGLGVKNEAWQREHCTVYAESGQLSNKGVNQRRVASYPQNSTIPHLQMLSVWQMQLCNKQFC